MPHLTNTAASPITARMAPTMMSIEARFFSACSTFFSLT
jgi:hypothetical protein